MNGKCPGHCKFNINSRLRGGHGINTLEEGQKEK